MVFKQSRLVAIEDVTLNVKKMENGNICLYTETHSYQRDTSNFVRTLIERQDLQVGSPDETAF